MREVIPQIVRNLLTVKSLVTLMLTAVFALMTLKGGVSQEFMTIYTVVIAFYFGTQAARSSQPSGGPGQ